MIDLSFELGIPAHELAERLPESEFVLYQIYAGKRMLPTRRMEMHLAQLTRVLANVHGNEMSTADYLFDVRDETVQATAEEAKAYFGFAPRKKRGK